MYRKLSNLLTDRTFLMYVAIGLTGVTLDFVLYVIFTKTLHVSPVIANFLSISIAIANNFLLNRRLNFKVYDRSLLRFLFFYAVGLSGILLSELLLIAFHYIGGLDAVFSKVLTLPIVLLFQYFLNRRISFGSIEDSIKITRKILFHWPLYSLALALLLCLSVSAMHIPSNFTNSSSKYAPDEAAHYIFNVEFILTERKLPISGVDDIDAYKNCRNNPNTLVPCLYSYTFYPGASYVVDAMSANILPKMVAITPQVAARVPAIIYGIIFLVCSYFSAYIITKRRLIASALAFGVAFIPQFIFTSSYTNLDAHSVAISGLLGLALVFFLTNPQHKLSIPFLAITLGGLLPLAKYNFFVLAIPVLLLIAYHFFQQKQWKNDVIKLTLWAVVSFIIFSSFWFVRNFILYGDPFGQGFAIHEMEKYHTLGESRPLNLHSLTSIAQMGFFQILYRSFYVAYGAMFYFLDESRYVVPAALATIASVILLFHIAEVKTKNIFKQLLGATGVMALTGALVFGAVIYNSLIFDFQPQGRYMFPILIGLVLYLAYCVKLDKKLEILVILFASSTLFIFINGVELFAQVYLNG